MARKKSTKRAIGRSTHSNDWTPSDVIEQLAEIRSHLETLFEDQERITLELSQIRATLEELREK